MYLYASKSVRGFLHLDLRNGFLYNLATQEFQLSGINGQQMGIIL